METDDIPTTKVSDWQPITDPLDLAVIGKTGEEVSECGTALWRCVIQGVDEVEPETKKPNRDWLMEEIADVEAQFLHMKRHFNLSDREIMKRKHRKYVYKGQWYDSLMKQPKPLKLTEEQRRNAADALETFLSDRSEFKSFVKGPSLDPIRAIVTLLRNGVK